ncbi:hypothetical protein MBLNU230_g4395t1 [Neophaeotheca triangularis]
MPGMRMGGEQQERANASPHREEVSDLETGSNGGDSFANSRPPFVEATAAAYESTESDREEGTTLNSTVPRTNVDTSTDSADQPEANEHTAKPTSTRLNSSGTMLPSQASQSSTIPRTLELEQTSLSAPGSQMPPMSGQASHGQQAPHLKRPSVSENAAVEKSSRRKKAAPATKDSEDEEPMPDERSADRDSSFDPDRLIENFDWDDLSERYHQKLRDLAAEERQLYNEYNHLSEVRCNQMNCRWKWLYLTLQAQYFTVWISEIGGREVERSHLRQAITPASNVSSTNIYNRLSTHMAYVQNEENSLEEKRKHCKQAHWRFAMAITYNSFADVQVVQAFKSALQLLSNNG